MIQPICVDPRTHTIGSVSVGFFNCLAADCMDYAFRGAGRVHGACLISSRLSGIWHLNFWFLAFQDGFQVVASKKKAILPPNIPSTSAWSKPPQVIPLGCVRYLGWVCMSSFSDRHRCDSTGKLTRVIFIIAGNSPGVFSSVICAATTLFVPFFVLYGT